MMNRKHSACLAFALVCSWVLTLPTRAGQARVQLPAQAGQKQMHNHNKPLDMKQIKRLELQASKIRARIDQLRQVQEPYTQNVTEHLARRPSTKTIVIALYGQLYHTKRGQQDDFRVSDRILTVRRINDSKQITGYGVVVQVELNEMSFEPLAGSSIMFYDEVYVVNREDTGASIIHAIQP